jgi:hypothetical protein
MSVENNILAIVRRHHKKNISIDDYRTKLLDKVARAGSEKNIRRYIEAAIKAMHAKKVNGHIVDRFLSKISDQLAQGLENPDAEKSRNFAIASALMPEVRQRLIEMYRGAVNN